MRVRLRAAAVPAGLLVVLTPIAVAAWRACREANLPLGDHAYIALRALDVGTADQPLLGAWTSAAFGRPAEETFNNLGPLHSLFLAPWVRLLGTSSGLPAGAAALHALAVATVAWVAGRRAGRTGALAALLVAAGLAWTMGDALLADAWQPYQVMLPTLAALTAAWAMADGDAWCLPVFVAWASLVAQTHLSFVYLLAVTGVAALVAVGLSHTGRGRLRPAPVTVAALVAAAAWVAPVVEELGPGRGNLSRLWLAWRDQTELPFVGWARSVRIVAAVVALPPWWLRPSLTGTFQPVGLPAAGLGPAFGDPPGVVPSLAGLGLLALTLGAVAAFSRHDATGRRAAGFAAVVAVAAVVSVARLPVGPPFGLSAHMVRACWPAAAFITFGALLGPLRRLTARTPTFAVVPVALLGAVAALTVVPGPRGPLVPRLADIAAEPTVRRALAAVRGLDGRLDDRPLVLANPATLTDPFGPALVLDLAHRGAPLCVRDPIMARQVGPRRACPARPGGPVLEYRWGSAYAPPGSRPGVTVLYHDPGFDAHGSARLRALEHRLARHLRAGNLALDPELRLAATRHRWLRDLVRAPRSRHAAHRLAGSPLLGTCVADGSCDLGTRGNHLASALQAHRRRQQNRRLAIWVRNVADGVPRPAPGAGR